LGVCGWSCGPEEEKTAFRNQIFKKKLILLIIIIPYVGGFFLEIKLSVKNVGKSRLWFVDLRNDKKRFPATFNRKTKCSFKHKIANCLKQRY
jgi:hypothetical protein